MSVDSPNPYRAPDAKSEKSETNAQPAAGMTTGEKIFTAFIVLCAGFLLAALAMWHFFIIPGTEDPGLFYFLVSILWIEFIALSVTAGLNLYHDRLLFVPTIIQGVVLCLAVYFFPFGLLAFLLLYRSEKRRASSDSPSPPRG